MPDRHKHPPISLRLTPEVLAAIDAARGGQLSRSAWLLDAVSSKLAGEVVLPSESGNPAVVTPPKPRRQRPRQTASVAAELARERPQDQRESNCKHEHKIKGWCRECGTGGL